MIHTEHIVYSKRKREYETCPVCHKKFLKKKKTQSTCGSKCSSLFLEYKCKKCYQTVIRPRVFGKGDFCSWECRTGRKAGRGIIDKQDIYDFYEYTCFLCNNKIDIMLRCPHPLSMTLDHVIPKSQGGKSDWTNLVPAHSICNAKKSDIIVPELLSKLRIVLYGFDIVQDRGMR